MQQISTDYLIIGSGASGLAFADTLLEESEAHITIVDRHGKPGGHWNDAYSFVTLHQPSAFYGVNSLELGSGRKDTVGLNSGLAELASGPEINGYYERVMNQRLLPSGRVSYFPLCNYVGDKQFDSLLSGRRTRVEVRKRLVDANYFGPRVPATHQPKFDVAAGVRLLPPNALPGLWNLQRDSSEPPCFMVVGAGKTAMDACVWLIQSGANPDAIQWVVPRDSWLINRASTQNAPEFFEQAIGGQADQMQAFAQAASVEDLFLRLEACGNLLRIDPTRTPSMFHLATVAPGEIEVLRRIKNVVRLGRVLSLHADHMQLEQGRVAVQPNTLFIDCTASAVEPRETQAVFQGENKIVLQLLRLPLPTFSAALTAYVEAHFEGDKQKNRLCTSVPFPQTLADYPRAMMASMWNQFQWGQHPELRQWIRASRLDGFGKLMAGAALDDAAKQATIARFKEQAAAAMANLPNLLAAHASAP
jgi:hypothetical protein